MYILAGKTFLDFDLHGVQWTEKFLPVPEECQKRTPDLGTQPLHIISMCQNQDYEKSENITQLNFALPH